MALRKATKKTTARTTLRKTLTKATGAQKPASVKQTTTAKTAPFAKKYSLINKIRERAYFIWLERQLPEAECWLMAEAEFKK